MTGITVASWILGSVLVVMTLLFIFRIVLTWYPGVNLSKLPLSLIAWPTEPFLVLTENHFPQQATDTHPNDRRNVHSADRSYNFSGQD